MGAASFYVGAAMALARGTWTSFAVFGGARQWARKRGGACRSSPGFPTPSWEWQVLAVFSLMAQDIDLRTPPQGALTRAVLLIGVPRSLRLGMPLHLKAQRVAFFPEV